MTIYMGQIMAECDCTHPACEQRGYCMAARIEELEAKLAKFEAMTMVDFANYLNVKNMTTLAELTGGKDE